MDYQVYFSMNAVSAIIVILCCITVLKCFTLRKYAFPFLYGALVLTAVVFETVMVAGLINGVDWLYYALFPICLIVNCLSYWAGTLSFDMVVGSRLLKTRKAKALLMLPAIIPLVVFYIELGTGNVNPSVFTKSLMDVAYWSMFSTAIVSAIYFVFGLVILITSFKEMIGTQKKLVNYIAFALLIPLMFNLIAVGANLPFEYIWAPYAIAILIMLLTTLRLTITRDALTQIKNRAAFDKDIKSETRFMNRKNSFFLIMSDIDAFKQINDTYGHEYGDRVIMRVAKIIDDKATETNATAYRIGGDEFAIVFQDHRRLDVEEYIMHVNEAVKNANLGISISLSMGICEYSKGSDLKSFLIEADRKMYEQKHRKQ